ncbi:MAG: thioredoxin-disulfide reductase [Spirochaetia bacterium]|nr:thioredoxin-disulfide reductase [Spirochaetia bacterium]MCF7946432.1 thioredoxin-disulfide reductase [Spirochaetia bacterium]
MEVQKDIVIIGGGAAGLSAAQYGARANMRTTLIEEMSPGGQALVIDDLENYPGFPTPLSGFELTQRFMDQANKFGAELMSATVKSVRKEKNYFIIDTTEGQVTSYTVIYSTGAHHRKLNCTGEEEFSGKGVSYCATCDGPFFKGKKMLVVGGGDAACDEASYLSKLSDNIVQIHRRDRFRAQKSLGDRVLANENIEVRFNHELQEIKGEQKVSSVILLDNKNNKTYEEEFDAVFIFVGSIPQTDSVPQGVELDEAGYIQTDQCMKTSVSGIYAAGDVRSTPFRQLVVAAGEGAIASHCASQYIDEIKGQAYN